MNLTIAKDVRFDRKYGTKLRVGGIINRSVLASPYDFIELKNTYYGLARRIIIVCPLEVKNINGEWEKVAANDIDALDKIYCTKEEEKVSDTAEEVKPLEVDPLTNLVQEADIEEPEVEFTHAEGVVEVASDNDQIAEEVKDEQITEEIEEPVKEEAQDAGNSIEDSNNDIPDKEVVEEKKEEEFVPEKMPVMEGTKSPVKKTPTKKTPTKKSKKK